MKPIIAIVGRPNVGKSTLFNRLAGKRKAIVEDEPGVTRDRNYAEASYEDHPFILIDTGGFEPLAKDRIQQQIREQVEVAIQEA
ncbi:MAG: GTPase, partial [Thermodesulfobacteriota bacterium]